MTAEREFRTPLLGATVIVLAGSLLALAALAVLSPTLLVGLAPDWFSDPGTARLGLRVAGVVAIAVAVLGVAAAGWLMQRSLSDAQRGAGGVPRVSARTAAAWLFASSALATWLAAGTLTYLAVGRPEQVVDVAPSLFRDYGTTNNTMTLVGLLIVGIPVGAAVVAGSRGRRGTAVVLALFTVVLLLPAVMVVRQARNEVQHVRSEPTECVYFVGGYDCPGD